MIMIINIAIQLDYPGSTWPIDKKNLICKMDELIHLMDAMEWIPGSMMPTVLPITNKPNKHSTLLDSAGDFIAM